MATHTPDLMHNPSHPCTCTIDRQQIKPYPPTVAIRYCPLHAAAPELLAALYKIRQELAAGRATTIDGIARAAIARAEGRD